jgi:hexosaminidase
MMKRFLTLVGLLGCLNALAYAQKSTADAAEISIVPRPLNVHRGAGKLTVNRSTAIIVDSKNPELKRLGDKLSAHIRGLTGYHLPVKTGTASGANVIVLTLSGASDTLGQEGYTLSVRRQRLLARAKSPQGLFYALQSICQLMPDKAAFHSLKTLSLARTYARCRPLFLFGRIHQKIH